MKKTLYLFLLFLLSKGINAQNVTITPNGITPALSGNYPRVSYEAIQALPSPQKGDIAYDTTFGCLRVYTGEQWLCTYQDIEDYVPNIAPVLKAGGSSIDNISDIAVSTNGDIYIAGMEIYT